MIEEAAKKFIKLMVTIVDRDKGAKVVNLYRSENLHFNYICLGFGTANSETLDYFGLSESEKDIVLTMVPDFKLPQIMEKATEEFRLIRAGKGLIFTLPLSGISSQIPHILCKPEYLEFIEESGVKQKVETKYDLIITILNVDYIDKVMDAAKHAGASGGTVLHARRVGYEDMENIWGFTIQPEKEVVAILALRSNKNAIMQEINKSVGLKTESHGIVFSLPVDDIMGLQLFENPDEEKKEF